MSETPSIYPTLRYRDARAAMDFLERAFGFEQVFVAAGEGEEVVHAELRYGVGMVMVSESRAPRAGPPPGQDFTTAEHSIYVVVDDVDAHAERARAAGAEIFRGPVDTEYGSREYSARDLDGYLWSFGTYVPGSYST
jgi:uncharacterized glyoxalase superfamily protein PhnB